MAGGTKTCDTSIEKLVNPWCLACHTAMALAGLWFQILRRRTPPAGRICLPDSQRIEPASTTETGPDPVSYGDMLRVPGSQMEYECQENNRCPLHSGF
jgi:hypothetical protein